MNSYWQEFSLLTKFSIVAFLVTCSFGYLSMGMLGLLLYYPISFVIKPFYGSPNSWTGDNLWPSAIWVGILWSLGFLIASAVCNLLNHDNLNILTICFMYSGILWLWALCLWVVFLSRKM